MDYNEATQEIREDPGDIDLLLTKDLLRKYIASAKKEFDPIFTREAGNRVIEFKEEILRINKKKEKIRKITQQKLFRVLTILCKAYARIALKNEITINDVQQIIDIYKISLSIQDLI